jgi:hypothetical protein
MLARRPRGSRIVESKLQLNFSRHHTRLLASPLVLQGIPLCSLFHLSVGKYVLQCQIELSQIVLPKYILVPTAAVEEKAVDPADGHLAYVIPFGIKRLGDVLRRISRFAERED